MTKRVSVATAKARLSEMIREVERDRRQVVIERRGTPVAVLEPYDPSRVADGERHWSEALRGVVADVDDFARIMDDVVRSRRSARPRKVDLER
jgi:prevent-host-death family protein